MTDTFKCPSCGGPLEYDGGEKPTVVCPFCSNVVIVPEELRPAKAGTAQLPNPPPAGTGPSSPAEIRAKIREERHAAREKRRELRHQLRRARRDRNE